MSAKKGKTQMFSRNARLLVAVCALLATTAATAIVASNAQTATSSRAFLENIWVFPFFALIRSRRPRSR